MRSTLWSAAFGFLGVALGAFGAHALKKHVTPADLAVWETAVKYQLVHALALMGVELLGFAAAQQGHAAARAPLNVASWAFIVGVVLFSGSLYALVGTGVRKLGMVTPLGGVAFLVGWAALAQAAWRMRGG